MNEKILILGAGVTGIFIGTKLAHAGFDVSLCGRNKLNQLKDQILINEEAYEVPAKIDEIKNAFFDTIFVTTKLYDLENALEQIRDQNISYDTIVFTQNGIISDDFLIHLDKSKIVNIVIFDGYSINEDGTKITAQKSVQPWAMKESNNSSKIKEILNKAGIETEIRPDFEEVRAEKMIVNAAIGILSIVKKKTIGEIIDSPGDKKILSDLVDEDYAVFKTKYNLKDIEEVRQHVFNVLNNNKQHYPSAYQDFIQGRKTEIDFINGQLIDWADKANISVPVNKEVYNAYKVSLTI